MTKTCEPKTDTLMALAEDAYNGYAMSTGGKTFDGRLMPEWKDLGDNIHSAWRMAIVAATSGPVKVLTDGLVYHEHDGHNMPKSVARRALVTLGVPEEDQP